MKKKKDFSPLPTLWKYKADDITTHKYKECIVRGDIKSGTCTVKWILNPDFLYRHLERPTNR